MPTLTKKSPKKETAAKKADKTVVYEFTVTVCDGEKAITAEQAKQLLGWEEEGESKFGADYLLMTPDKKKIRCNNNTTNRDFQQSLCDTWKQEILRKKWRLNGETIIFGKFGNILSGQHRLVALILAAAEWQSDKDKYGDFWKTEPTLQSIIVYGVNEDEETANTIDTGRGRSLADVIYRSDVFKKVEAKDKKQLSRFLEHAIRKLWERTGADKDGLSPKRTHAELMEFYHRHERLKDSVIHIYQENAEQGVTKFIGGGYASALLYLMSACDTNPAAYNANRVENNISFDRWEDATEFWVLLASKSTKMNDLRTVLGKMMEDESDGNDERVALLIKAWASWLKHGRVKAEDLNLEFKFEDDIRIFDEDPSCGGIDFGRTGTPAIPLSEDDVETTKRQIRNEKKGKFTLSFPEIGSHVWINDPQGDGIWDGILVSIDGDTATIEDAVKHKDWEVSVDFVQEDEPDIDE